MKKFLSFALCMVLVLGMIGAAFADEAEVMTYEDYVAAEIDDAVTVVCYVQDHQSPWDNKVTVYAQDEDGAYFIYNMECTEEDAELLVPGTKICVTGYKAEWAGEVEIADATFTFVELAEDEEAFIAEAEDVTALLADEEALAEHMNEFVAFKGMTVEASTNPDGEEVAFLYNWDGSGEDGNDLYFNVSLDGNIYNFTVESYLRGAGTEVYEAVKALQIGDVIDLEGFLYWYYGANPHITSVGAAE